MTFHIPTSLSDEKVREFQALYLKKTGKEIEFDIARDEALKAIQFIGLVIKNNPRFHHREETTSEGVR